MEGTLDTATELQTQNIRTDGPCRIALLYPGDREARLNPAPEKSRFAQVFEALGALGAQAEPAVYHDDFRAEVARQLLELDGVLVWVNPIESDRDRTILDAMLREVSAAGVFVSAHPDVILKLGTKEVLYTTRDLGWGCETYLYRSLEQLRRELPTRLGGGTRVLKQYRGNGGDGVWKVEVEEPGTLRVRHAKRGCVEETLSLDEFMTRCERYFSGEGRMIEQAFQPRIAEGMVRCYLVHGTVAGFGHQAINALHPQTTEPGPRLYHPPELPQFQELKGQLEREWVPALQGRLGIETERLPILWDCDFMLGAKRPSGEDTYVLCEINVSSVSPFPESAVIPMAQAAVARAQAARRERR
jgi:glutathione synthase/RimK-type ligase-like ATP-grasp enzyme